MTIATIGLDSAKHVFQVQGVDAEGRPALRRRLRRAQLLEFFAGLPRCLAALEACSGAHFWAREIGALGHEIRLPPPQYVRPDVKRGENDAADAEAIREAATRHGMRLVPAKAPGQQALLVLHRTRELLVRQRTMAPGSLRSHMAESGVVAAQGARNVDQLLAVLADPDDRRGGSPRSPTRRSGSSPPSSPASGGASRRSRRGSSPGTGRARPAAGWPPSRASGRSRPARSSPPWPTSPSSARGGSSPPGWA